MEIIPIFLAVDEQGNRAVSLEDATEARNALNEDHESAAIRSVKLNVHLELPEAEEIDIEVPKEEPAEAEVEVEEETEEAEVEEETETEPEKVLEPA